MTPRATKLLSFCAEGPFALFTCPAFKTEKVSYDVMTVPAARGIVQTILWKPAVDVDIERIVVCNPIRRGTMTQNYLASKTSMPTRRHREDPSLLIYDATDDSKRIQIRHTMLLDVRYVVYFRYYMTDQAGPDDNPIKFEEMFRKRLLKGASFQDPHFGLQQHVADCRPVKPTDTPIDDTKDLGMMPHYRIYETDEVGTAWFPAQMVQGVIEIPSQLQDPVPRDPRPTPPIPTTDTDEDLRTLERRQQLEREELERMQARDRAELARKRALDHAKGQS
jgi:CRISPR-associated protein Cas5d